MIDLYPDPKWNFCLGEADIVNRVGVFSFARGLPSFPRAIPSGSIITRSDMSVLLLRAVKTCVHELFHIFGVHHCQYYDCIMQGCNTLAESDTHGIDPCPVCLHKLHLATGVDLVQRYTKLYDFYKRHEVTTDAFATELKWLHHRMQHLKLPIVSGSQQPIDMSQSSGGATSVASSSSVTSNRATP